MTQVAGRTEAFIGLGANLGDARAAVTQAIAQIAQLPQSRLVRQSSLYCSAPVDASGDDYVNAVVEIATGLSPLELLRELQQLELQADRQRPYRNAPRTLDLDILLYGDMQLDSPELTIPHSRLWQRGFVVLPLAEIAPARVSAAQRLAVSAEVSGQILNKLLK